MKYVKMNTDGSCRGQEYVPGTILEVSDSLSDSMILGGKASPSTKEAFEAQKVIADTKSYRKMTPAELAKVDYKSLNKDPLIEYAKACGLEIGSETKDEIYLLIEAIDFD